MNVFQYSAIVEANWKANLGDMTDWTPSYTFYSDFAIAEFCEVYMRDKGAIKDTYKRVIESWGSDYKAFAEVIIVLNHKIWAFYGDERSGVDTQYLGLTKEYGNTIARLYNELWEKAVNAFLAKYKDNEEALTYYYNVTD